MKEKEIGEFFRENFAGYEPVPSDNMWENIQHAPEIKRYNKTASLKRILGYSAITLAVATAVVVGYLLLRPSDQPVISPDVVFTDTLAYDQNIRPSETGKVEMEVIAEKSEITAKEVIKPLQSREPASPVRNANTASSPVTTSPGQDFRSQDTKVDIISEPLPEMPEIELPYVAIENAIPPVPSEIINPEEIIDNTPSLPEQETRLESLLLIPKAFTPNSDGLNDVFLVFASSRITDYEMHIYDRTGKLIFKSTNIDSGWDGNVSGQIAPEGVYIYLINYKDYDGVKRQEKGSLILIK